MLLQIALLLILKTVTGYLYQPETSVMTGTVLWEEVTFCSGNQFGKFGYLFIETFGKKIQ